MAPWTKRIQNLPGQRPAAAAPKAAPEPPPEADEAPEETPAEEPAGNVAPTNKPPWANRKLPSGAPAEPATQAGPPATKPAKAKAAPKPKAQPAPAPVEAPADPSDPGLRMTLSIEGSPADLMALLQAISG